MRLFLPFLTAAAALAFAASADAAMILTTTFRSVGSSPSPPIHNTTTGAFDADTFGSVFAEQHSNITDTALSGELSAFRDHTAFSSGHSSFHVEFTLAAPHSFTLTATSIYSGAFSGDTSLISLTGSISPQAVSVLSTSGAGSLNETGILGPGTYVLSAGAFTDGGSPASGNAATNFEFTVSPLVITIPEPGTLALACVGMGAALIARRTKRRQRPRGCDRLNSIEQPPTCGFESAATRATRRIRHHPRRSRHTAAERSSPPGNAGPWRR
jgi:hypothetical protein